MPTYDYKCPNCKKIHTIQHSLSDENKRECATCKCEMNRTYGAIPAHFKGEGFYTTDKFKD